MESGIGKNRRERLSWGLAVVLYGGEGERGAPAECRGRHWLSQM